MGRTLQRFFEEHPDGAVDITNAIMQCPKCKNYLGKKLLTMYVPKQPKRQPEQQERQSEQPEQLPARQQPKQEDGHKGRNYQRFEHGNN